MPKCLEELAEIRLEGEVGQVSEGLESRTALTK